MKKFIQNMRKLSTLFTARCVPKNTYLKPKGVHPAGVSDENVHYLEVYKDYQNIMDISDELYTDLMNYARPENKTTTLTYFVADIPNGRVYAPNPASVAVINQSNMLVGDMSFNYRKTGVVEAKDNNIFQQLNFAKPRHYAGTLFTMLTGGGGATNYGHWLIDAIPRIHLLRKSGLFDLVDWFLVPECNYDFQWESLDLLGIDRKKVIQSPIGTHVSADRLLASTAPRGDSVTIPKWVNEFYVDAIASIDCLPNFDAPYVYIRRSDSGIRNVTNETLLMEMLGELGFKCFELRSLSFREKVGLFMHAKVILSVHGAGLTNLLFCPKEAHFFELFPDQFVLTTYANLAANNTMSYEYMLCPSSEKAKNAKKGQKVHVTVDVEAVKKRLNQTIPNNSVHSRKAS